jgi:hypothetical protein
MFAQKDNYEQGAGSPRELRELIPSEIAFKYEDRGRHSSNLLN